MFAAGAGRACLADLAGGGAEPRVGPSRSLDVQFGSDDKHHRGCPWQFRRALEASKQLWTGIDAEPREKELLFRPCAPSMLN